MKHLKQCCLLLATIVFTDSAFAAASIDMNDPRRALGREDDIRVDAQLVQDTISPGASVGVIYQIQNLSKTPIAIADRTVAASYDSDTGTVTLSIGAEVPEDGRMPHIVTIAPGATKTFRTGAAPAMNVSSVHASNAPRVVQIKVSILRDLTPFASLISGGEGRGGQLLSDALFDQWFESNNTIFLNTIPVRFTPRRSTGAEAEADQHDASGGGY